MRILPTDIPDVLVLEPKVFGDERGFFLESFNQRLFDEAVARPVRFVQDNHSRSARGVLRGLHYQNPRQQAKLVRVTRGSVFDVALDIRRNSPTFGRWVATILSAQGHQQLWIPEGFAHGFLVLEDGTDFLYKTTDYYFPEHEHCIRWDDPSIGITWPAVDGGPTLSRRDANGEPLSSARGLF